MANVTMMTPSHNLSDVSAANVPDGCVVWEFYGFVPWDNPDNLVSLRTNQQVGHYKAVLALPLLFLIGGPSNVINMAVFYRLGLRERINLLLFLLSFTDLAYMVENMFVYAERIHTQFTTGARFGPLFQFMIANKLVGFFGFCWASQFLSAVIASERCFCILKPLKAKVVLSTKVMAIIVIVGVVVLVGLFFIIAFRYDMVCVFDPSTNSTTIQTSQTSAFYRHNKVLVNTLEDLVYGVILTTTFTTVVTATTAVTAVKLRQAAAWRAGTVTTSAAGVTSARELAVTRMLVFTSGLFLFCYFPIIAFRLACLKNPELNLGHRLHNTYQMLVSVTELFSYVNSSFNFFIYFTLGSRYRELFWRLWGRTGAPPGGRGKEDHSLTLATTVSGLS